MSRDHDRISPEKKGSSPSTRKIRKPEMNDRNEKELHEMVKKSEEVLMAKSLFLASMSDEIKIPISGILGTISLLKDTHLTHDQKQFLEVIEISAKNLLSIFNDIVDISKIETGEFKIKSDNFHLLTVLNEVERNLAAKAKEKKLDYRLEVGLGVPVYIMGDSFRLKQVLMNLIGNAVKFTKKGSVIVSVQKKEADNDHVELLFKITDTGVGITEEVQDNLFKEHPVYDSLLTKKHEGTGLGLIITKSLVNMMNGKIGVESEPGVGSTFWFTIVAPMGKSPARSPISITEEKKEDQKILTILVAEDNIINQKVAVASIKQQGHDAEVAINGKMAVEMFKKNRYDAILMDIQMPVMDGMAATQEIRRIEKERNEKNPVKIIAITANVMQEDREKCLTAGMDEYITKPFKIEDLEQALGY